MTPIAHAVRFAYRCGIVTVSDLAKECECTPSAIYRALKQLQSFDHTVTINDGTVTIQYTSTVTERSNEVTVWSVSDCTVTQQDPLSPLKKERSPPAPPLKKKITPLTPACLARENDEPTTVEKMAKRLARIHAGPFGAPEQHMDAAINVVQSNIDSFGEKETISAVADMVADYEGGKKFSNVWKQFVAYCEIERDTAQKSANTTREQDMAEFMRAMRVTVGSAAHV